ncbi:MAG TPA: phosphotransferase, partial [Pirellula sp.]|nr:phosphotransferase [Pirellula sp.]
PSLYHWHPHGAPLLRLLHFEDYLWTLSDWVPGQPTAQRNVDKSLVQHLAAVLGRLHANSVDALGQDVLPLGQQLIRSNSIRERLDVLKSLDQSLFSAIDEASFFSTYDLSHRVKHCIAIIFERGPDWHRFLEICVGQTRTCHWIVRDLWRENVLLNDTQRFSSIVDLGAARFDWPGLDFVRLFGSLSYGLKRGLITDSDKKADLWVDAYAAYALEHTSHAIHSLDECRMLHVVSTGLSIVQWVQWIQRGTFDVKQLNRAQRVSDRISELCDNFLIEAT